MKSNNKLQNINYWLCKSDPETYSWNDLLKKKETIWDGVRNYQARNNLKKMKKGDIVLFYHSGQTPGIFGIAKVTKESFPDPTAKEELWVAVKIKADKSLKNAVSLEQIKMNKKLQNIGLLKQSRLSVMPLTKAEFDEIVRFEF